MRLTFDGGDHNGDNDKDRVITGTRARHTAIRLNGSLWCLIIYLAQFLVSLQPVAGQLYEGSTCRTRNGTLGLCKIHRHCVWAMNGYRARTFTIADMVRCGFQGRDELICCLDDMPDLSTTEAGDDFLWSDPTVATSPMPVTLNPRVPAATPTPPRLEQRPSVRECTRFENENSGLTFHILGGEATSIGDYPHMAAIGYPSEEDGISWRCGGSLISENFILTAAHCATREQPSVVRLGEVNLQGSNGLDVPIAQVIMHPEYVPSRNYHDIALLRLAQNITMNENVYPACLRTSVDDVPNESFEVTGWGDTSVERRQRSDILLKTNLTGVDLATCNETYSTLPRERRLPNLLHPGMLCAHDARAINDACQGDSGGPLQVKRESFFNIVGITSFGNSCGTEIPSVFTRVAFYLSWIESVVWPGN